MSEAEITLYVRDACLLCDEAEGTLRAVLAERGGGDIAVVNIESSRELHHRLVADIPAIEIGDRLLANAGGRRRIAAFLEESLR